MPARQPHQSAEAPLRRPRSERLDADLDPRIFSAVGELLAEQGYDAMSIEGVAARAGVGKTSIYRRWSGKPGLVLDALEALVRPITEAPATGTLRDDLLTTLRGVREQLDESGSAQLAGLMTAIRRHPELATAVRERLARPWQEVTAEIVARAVERGEIPERDPETVELFSQVLPGLMAHRVLVLMETIDDPWPEDVVDRILMPILTAEGR